MPRHAQSEARPQTSTSESRARAELDIGGKRSCCFAKETSHAGAHTTMLALGASRGAAAVARPVAARTGETLLRALPSNRLGWRAGLRRGARPRWPTIALSLTPSLVPPLAGRALVAPVVAAQTSRREKKAKRHMRIRKKVRGCGGGVGAACVLRRARPPIPSLRGALHARCADAAPLPPSHNTTTAAERHDGAATPGGAPQQRQHLRAGASLGRRPAAAVGGRLAQQQQRSCGNARLADTTSLHPLSPLKKSPKVIDDTSSVTLVSASTLTPDVQAALENGNGATVVRVGCVCVCACARVA